MLTPEMLVALLNNGLGGLAIVLLLRVNQQLAQMTKTDDDHEMRLGKLEKSQTLKKVVLAFAVVFMLSGCLQFSTRDALDSGAKAAVEGFAQGGPIGGIIGGIAGIIGGGFALKKHGQCKRREKIISHYRNVHGDIPNNLLEKIAS